MSKRMEAEYCHELISFDVRLQEVALCFGAVVVAMDSVDVVSTDGSVEAIESIWKRIGNLNALWPLIGRVMTKWIMDADSFRLYFADGTILRRKYQSANSLVDIWGPDRDNFTSYPEALEEPGPEAKQMIADIKRKFGL